MIARCDGTLLAIDPRTSTEFAGTVAGDFSRDSPCSGTFAWGVASGFNSSAARAAATAATTSVFPCRLVAGKGIAIDSVPCSCGGSAP